MNERIDALVKKATIRVNNPILNTDGEIVVDDWEEGVSISMLAELIIKECIAICMKNQYDGAELYNNGSISSAEFIKEHFGVKE